MPEWVTFDAAAYNDLGQARDRIRDTAEWLPNGRYLVPEAEAEALATAFLRWHRSWRTARDQAEAAREGVA